MPKPEPLSPALSPAQSMAEALIWIVMLTESIPELMTLEEAKFILSEIRVAARQVIGR